MEKDKKIPRRDALGALAVATVSASVPLASCVGGASSSDASSGRAASGGRPASGAPVGSAGPAAPAGLSAEVALHASGEPGALRPLGKTGLSVEAVSLGGEGALRTTGRSAAAVPVILEALRLGVRYCDTAPAYQQSQDYYGEAFRAAGPGARDKVILASKTHIRDRDGALRLLDDSLRRLGTDHLDIWQLHDLRTQDDLDEIFSANGAIKAVEQAKADKRIRFVGITGHHDPLILVEAMRRYPVDTVLCAMNPADPRRSPFLRTVVPEARRRGVGVVGMKVMGAGRIVSDSSAQPEELIRYASSFADTVIIGCSSVEEVRRNLTAGRTGRPMDSGQRLALEERIAPSAHRYDTFKAG